jgi:predicted dehydrogenase
MNRRLRLGMVGGGQGAFIGAVHRTAARMDDQWELVAGALSADHRRSHASAAELHIAADRSYADYHAMARAEAARPDGIDAVAIVTPNHLHAPVTRAFLQAGIHVICDKPLCFTLDEGLALAQTIADSGRVFVLTHNYTGHPMVRHAREMVAAGALGALRLVHVEYPQDWLSTPLETTGHKQSEWRTDPARSGAGGCVGDIGTHALNLAEFVTGLQVESLAAELTTFVPGRRLDDNVQVLLRFAGGARGMLWTSQVAPGHENGLRLRVYGEKGGIEWWEEEPNHIRHGRLGATPEIITRGGPTAGPAAAHATRVPAGHPEGYIEGFAQIYTDAAELVRAAIEARPPGPQTALLPGIAEGLRGMRFIEACVASSRADAAWRMLG